MGLRNTITILCILGMSPVAWAQGETSTSASSDNETGWYVIRPGDTLRSLTTRYLGSPERWRENWKLNVEEIANPDLIEPGQRIRLLLPPNLPTDGALLRQVSNRVEDQPTPMSWIEAQNKELLRARDGVKTYEDSSAELQFPDDTRLLLTEQSIVFIGEEVKAQEQIDRTQIEIIVGQADLAAPRTTAATDRYEIVLGDATATPRRDPEGSLETRARMAETGGAQLMVYSGESELAAAGAKLTVGSGMGSSVTKGEPPAPPEKLLPAARELEPGAGTRLATPQPTFRWQPVADAQHYLVEICRDPRCAVLLQRAAEISDSSWQPAALPVASLFWRVTAVSPSGLDGYPSDAVAFEISSTAPDADPPEVEVSFVGPQLAPRSGLNETWIVGPGTEIEIEVTDAESGVERWTPLIDSEEVELGSLKGPFSKGGHSLSVVATDRAGNRKEKVLRFVFDPDPPAVSWGVEGTSALGDAMSEQGDLSGAEPALRGRRQLRVGKLDWELDSDLAQIRARPQTRKPIGLEGLGSLGPRQGLWVLASDEHCPDLRDLSYDLVAGSRKGEVVLHFAAVDCVGNARRGQIPLVRQSKRK